MTETFPTASLFVKSKIEPAAHAVCHLRQTLNSQEVWPLMGLTALQAWEMINNLLQSLEYDPEIESNWIAITREYNASNGKCTIYTNFPSANQQSRDSRLLTKRYELLTKTLFNGLFLPGSLNFQFIQAGTPEWNSNRKGLQLDGLTYSNRREHGTVPRTFTATVFVYEKPRIHCNNTRMKVLTGNFLHELVHALFEAYTCACLSCEKNLLEVEGITGHGPAWMYISREVEKTMLRLFGYRCWLGRSQSLAHEHHAKQHRHSEAELRAYEVNEKLYCEARIDFGEDELDVSISFYEDDFARKGDAELDFAGLESDYSEDEDDDDLDN